MGFANSGQWVWLGLFAALFFAAWFGFRSRANLLSGLSELGVLERFFSFSRWKKRERAAVLLEVLGLFLLVVALAGPEVGQKLEAVRTRGLHVFILMDCSDSMLAEDFKPNRMGKAKRVMTGLVEKIAGNKVGIIAFAGEPYVYCPMTFDSAAVRSFLKGIEPGMIPQMGTRIGSAVRLALSKMPEAGGGRAIVVLTDGEDHESDPLGAAEECRKAGVTLYTVGIGKPEGEPIPIRDDSGRVTGFRKNKKGEVVLSKLGESDLAQMAVKTGGSYYRTTDAEQEIDLLASALNDLEKSPALKTRNAYENRYQWVLSAALLCLILSRFRFSVFRRGPFAKQAAVLLVAGAALFSFGQPLGAESFTRKMRKGNRLYRSEKYQEALESYQAASGLKPADPRADFNLGDAAYKLEKWDEASESFQKSSQGPDSRLRAKSFYNLGNSAFQKKDYSSAVRSYQQSLKLDPADAEAKHNLQMALQMMKMQQQQQQQKDQKQDQKQGGSKEQQAKRSEEEKKEREENAKQMLKKASDNAKDRPVFNPGKKGKRSDEEYDW